MGFFLTTVLPSPFPLSPRFTFCTSFGCYSGDWIVPYMYSWSLVRLYRVFAGYYTVMYESRQDLAKDEHTPTSTQFGKLYPAA